MRGVSLHGAGPQATPLYASGVPEAGQIVAARYQLERALAQGGMGSLWCARHLQLDVSVAIKFMSPEFADSPELRGRFEREAKAAALLKSPHAVQVHDYGIEDGTPFIVMELLEGEDLSERLAREGKLSLPATRSVVEQIGKALRRAHALGLVHRDLKPANVFLARQSGEEIVKLVDFGIAKARGAIAGTDPTQTGAMLGSPRYMSPEQIRSSAQVDERTDLWSLGVIAFRCLTGQLPFSGNEIGEVFLAICTEPIPRASSIAPELGPEVDRFFERALARPLDQRFQSAAELVEAFAELPGARDVAPASLASGASGSHANRTPRGDASWATERRRGHELDVLPTLAAPGPLASAWARIGAGRVVLAAGGLVAAIGLVVLMWRWSAPAAPAQVEERSAEAPAAPAEALPAAAPAPAPAAPAALPADPPATTPTAAPPTSAPKSRRTRSAGRPRRSDDLLDQM